MPADISVVIPTFRRPRELAEAIGSALAQEGATVEVIVIDDCPDGSAAPAVAAIADPRVSYRRNPVPTGGKPAVVRNLGWSGAAGDVIHFLDDDDLVPPGHYRAVLDAFARHPGVGVVFGRIEPFGDAALLPHERAYFARAARRAAATRRFGAKWAYAARLYFGETLLVCSAGVVRRECVAAVGGFDAEIPLCEDVDFYARVIRRFGAHFIDRVSVRYRIHPSLMHGAVVGDRVRQSYHRMLANYRAHWGSLDFWALRLFARTVLRVL
ncbi:MAG: glycosyltransferase family 2 protein [Alphaproteobacteria bacterium]|nr:glycosyltransferase family 2 protein [Alphaproteobacteria bacterium]